MADNNDMDINYTYDFDNGEIIPQHNDSLITDINMIENEYNLNVNRFKNHDRNAHELGPRISPDNTFFNNDSSSYKYYSHLQYISTINAKDCLNIIHLNARSLNANFKKIELIFKHLIKCLI